MHRNRKLTEASAAQSHISANSWFEPNSKEFDLSSVSSKADSDRIKIMERFHEYYLFYLNYKMTSDS